MAETMAEIMAENLAENLAETEESIRQDFAVARGTLNERTLRAFVAEKAMTLGYGGVTLVHRATGVARSTIKRGLQEMMDFMEDPDSVLPEDRIRREGGGRIPLIYHHPELNDSIERVLDPASMPEGTISPLKWTLDSTRRIAARLREGGLDVSPSTARKQLKYLGYTLQTTSRHMLGANQRPDGPAQFAYINGRVAAEIGRSNPVLSLESRKLGKTEMPPFGRTKFRSYPEVSRVSGLPRGIYEMARLQTSQTVSTCRDDSEFATQSIYGWWKAAGRQMFPHATLLYLTVGRGGCSFSPGSLWLSSVFALAGKIRLPVAVSHFQPGTSRWDPRLCRKLFSFFSTGWRGGTGADYETSVNLLGAADCDPALRVLCRLDHRAFFAEKLRGSPGEALRHTTPDEFRGDWNYTVAPRRKGRRRRTA
jgi:hypothetical protein